MKKFLIIQTAFIGDAVLAIPIAQVLKDNYKNSKVDFLCIPATSELLYGNKNIDDVIVYDKINRGRNLSEFIKILRVIRNNKYDYIITPHRFLRSTLISFMSGGKKTISFGKSVFSFLYKHKIKYSEQHEILRNLSLLQPLGIEERNIVRPELYPSQEDKEKVREIIQGLNITDVKHLISVAPGSVWFTKTFPKDKFVKLLNFIAELDIMIALIGSDKDIEICEYIINKSYNNNVYNYSGKLTLLQTAELISKSSVLITNDSAPIHIANAMQTPVIALFGATTRDFGFYPYGEKDKIIEKKGLECRPCTDHGSNKCPIGTFDCMEGIDEREILQEVKNMLAHS